MNKYEAVFVFDSALSESDIAQQLEKIDAIVKSHNGTIDRQDHWGRRDLAYKINKKAQGYYVILVISGDSAVVADLKRQTRINDAVLRSLIVVKDKYAPDYVRPAESPTQSFRESRPAVEEQPAQEEAEEASA
ncbi:MAG: 30S ribosomal protein S6 [Bdellovibrionota bacterium]